MHLQLAYVFFLCMFVFTDVYICLCRYVPLCMSHGFYMYMYICTHRCAFRYPLFFHRNTHTHLLNIVSSDGQGSTHDLCQFVQLGALRTL